MPRTQTKGQTRLKLPEQTPPPGSQQWVLTQLTQPRQNYKHHTQLTTCHNCAALILYGYATGYPVQADPINLNHQTQTIIHTAGRPLYQLTTNHTATHYELHLATGPNHAITVLTNHKCHHPPPGQPILTPPTPQPDNPPL